MADPVTRDDARAYMRRFALLAERQKAEAESQTLEEKFDELERLMLSIDDFGWREALDDDAEVRARWATLRQRFAEHSKI